MPILDEKAVPVLEAEASKYRFPKIFPPLFYFLGIQENLTFLSAISQIFNAILLVSSLFIPDFLFNRSTTYRSSRSTCILFQQTDVYDPRSFQSLSYLQRKLSLQSRLDEILVVVMLRHVMFPLLQPLTLFQKIASKCDVLEDGDRVLI